MFANTRAALASREFSRKYWSITCLNAIDKSKFIPIKKNDVRFKVQTDCLVLGKLKADIIVSFEQKSLIKDTTLMKQNLH